MKFNGNFYLLSKTVIYYLQQYSTNRCLCFILYILVVSIVYVLLVYYNSIKMITASQAYVISSKR